MANAAMMRMLPMMTAADSKPYTTHQARLSLSDIVITGGWDIGTVLVTVWLAGCKCKQVSE